MELPESLKGIYIERTCYEDYYNVRDIFTEHIIMSGSMTDVKGYIKCRLEWDKNVKN